MNRMFKSNMATSITALIFITLFGGMVRIIGIRWGLPNRLHPDEGTVVNWAIEMISRRSFEPGKFNRPDHFEIMLNSVLFNIYSVSKYFKTADVIFQTDIVPFYMIARYFTAFWGTAMIPLGYLILEKVKPKSGLIGAAVIAIFPSFVEHSRYATPDIPLAFMVMVFTWFSLKYLEDSSVMNLFLMSLFTAIGITIKYPALILCVMIAGLIIFQNVRKRSFSLFFSHGFQSLFFVICCTFMASPVLFTNIGKVIQVIRSEARTEHLGADGLGFFGNILYYGQQFLNQIGILFLLFIVFGFTFLIKKRNIIGIGLLTGFVYWIFLSLMALHWERWAVPMYISPILFGSLGISYFYELCFVEKRFSAKNRLLPGLLSLILLAIGINLIIGSTAKIVRFIIPDTRVVALEYCLENEISADNSLYEGWTPFRMSTSMKIFDKFDWHEDELAIKTGDSSYAYIIISSGMYDRYYAEPIRYSKELEVYEQIEYQFELIKKYPYQPEKNSVLCINNIRANIINMFMGWQNAYNGYEIKIYKLN